MAGLPIQGKVWHGVCGTFGTIAVGLFAVDGGALYGGGFHLLGVQLFGVAAVSLWGFSATYAVFSVLKAVVGIRVSEEDEILGLDISEHGVAAYTNTEYPLPQVPFPAMDSGEYGIFRQMQNEDTAQILK